VPVKGPCSLSDLTLSCCGKARFGHFLRSFLLNRMTIRLKRAQKLPQAALSLTADGHFRQAASSGVIAHALSAPWPQVALALSRCLAEAGVGKLGSMLGNPFAGDRLCGQRRAQFKLALVAVMFDLANLLDHAGAKQGVFINK
jgi:hypothetical protein